MLSQKEKYRAEGAAAEGNLSSAMPKGRSKAIPGVKATQDAYWKLGVYNPWNRRCEASLIDDDGKKETCGVVFTKAPVGDRPCHWSMEHMEYTKRSVNTNRPKRCNYNFRGRNVPSGICNTCYTREFNYKMLTEFGGGEDENYPWEPIDLTDPMMVAVLSRLEYAKQALPAQEDRDASKWLCLGLIVDGKVVEEEDRSSQWSCINPIKSGYYDSVAKQYNLPPVEYWLREGMEEYQADCYCTHPGKEGDGIIRKYLFFHPPTRTRLFLGSCCKDVVSEQRVCSKCFKKTGNRKDSWCKDCRAKRCQGLEMDDPSDPRTGKDCFNYAVDPGERFKKNRLCRDCKEYAEFNPEWKRMVRRSVMEERERREKEAARIRERILTGQERRRREREARGAGGEKKHEQEAPSARCVSCKNPVNRDRWGMFYRQCWPCKNKKLRDCPYYNICGNKYDASKWKHCWLCHSESWSS